MPLLNIVQSVNETLRGEMRRNANVVMLGEDIGKNGMCRACHTNG